MYEAPIFTRSRTQPCVALSSAEAELYGLSTVVMEAKGSAMFMEELYEYLHVDYYCEAAATLAVVNKLGPGKLKHIAFVTCSCRRR